jgi:alpha-tubulin suppressor-like RCC1 family protein
MNRGFALTGWCMCLTVLSAMFAACSDEPTQVLVTIEAEPGVRRESARLRLVVLGGVGRTTDPTASRLDRLLTPGGSDPAYPFVVALAPLDGDVGRSYSVTATAESETGTFVGQARLIGGYVEGETNRVRLVLEDACRTVRCGDTQTCRAGVCVDARTTPLVDGGVNDAGMRDGGARDGGGNSGSNWGRCVGTVCDEIAEVAVGYGTTCVRTRPSGTVYCWGANDSGQLGRGTQTPFELIPAPVELPGAASHIDIGLDHACAVVAGRAYCWGRGDFGKLGNGSETSSSSPVMVADIADFRSVSCGQSHTCGLKTDGYVVCWGGNGWGVLGDGSGTNRSRPVFAAIDGGVLDIQAAAVSSVMNRADAVPIAMGKITDVDTSVQPIAVLPTQWCDTGTRPAGTGYSGYATAYFIASDGRLYVQGSNEFGQRANGTTTAPTGTCRTTRADVSPVETIVTGGEASYAFARLRDGTWVGWGANQEGQLGLGRSSFAEARPQVVVFPVGTSKLFAGSLHACSLNVSGDLYCWGWNAKGALGNRTTTSSVLPVRVVPVTPPI